MFGAGRRNPHDRNAKVRVMHLARCLARQKEPGRQRGSITRAALDVLQALLWAFHNAKSGLCYPSYKGSIRISGVSRSGGLNGGSGVVVGEARVPSFEQWPERAVERACPDL